MTTALGVAPDSDGNGVTPLTHRRVQMYQWENTGVVGGLVVSGTTDATYEVSAGMAVTSRGDSDGYALAYSEGGTVETSAADSSNPRYDVIWIKSNDIAQGDDTNEVELRCEQGTAQRSPSVPDVPTGAVAIDTMLVPAGETATSEYAHLGEIDYAIPYGASLGLLGSYQNDVTGEAGEVLDLSEKSYTTVAYVTISAPTTRNIEIVYDMRAKMAVDGYTKYGSIYLYYTIDGATQSDSNSDDPDEVMLFHNWHRQQQSWYATVEKGNHVIAVKAMLNDDNAADTEFEGINRLYVYDRGIAS